MTGTCEGGKCGSKCTTAIIAKWLLIVGGLNWGIVGVSALFGSEFNLVHTIFSFSGTVESIVYVVVGLCAAMKAFGGCHCKKCMGVMPEAPKAM